jgi:hypothetical protein
MYEYVDIFYEQKLITIYRFYDILNISQSCGICNQIIFIKVASYKCALKQI